jgi:hypothetical protein
LAEKALALSKSTSE